MIAFLDGGSVTSPKGFFADGARCGIKNEGYDLAVLYSEVPCVAAGVFTQNKVKAAPVLLTQRHLASRRAQAIIANSGNANACTGEEGDKHALEMAKLAADVLNVAVEDVLVASTGIIGVPLPIHRIREGIKGISLSKDGGHRAAQAIMTTDTRIKEAACVVTLQDATVVIGGIAKGAGMIHPQMATMLAFITTDAAVEPMFLQHALRKAVDDSFNMISVDGDTSTNDMVIALANGKAGNKVLSDGTEDAEVFSIALNQLTVMLAKAIARDGEGATKLIEARIAGAASSSDARLAARAVVSSNLVKTAMYGSDPNWGRVIAAIGRSGAAVDQNEVDIIINDIVLMRRGVPQPFDKARAVEALKVEEIVIKADLNLGQGTAVAWGCDLSEEYVVVNSAYST